MLAACNNGGGSEVKKDSTGTAAADASSKKAIPEMPYKLDHPYANWQTGDPQHAATVMMALKGFETGDINACMSYFADSVKIEFDGLEGKFSKDSLGKMFTGMRSNYTGVSINMQDWESVISEDKKEQWVTLWYKQETTDKSGKKEYVKCINDAKIENGKIVQLNEAMQHPPAKKQ